MNFKQIMQQAQQVQAKMAAAQEMLEQVEVSGQAGGGMVVVTMNGKGELKRIKIDPKIVDASDVEMLEDLIVAACNDGKKKAEEASSQEMSKVTGGMGIPGLKMPF